MLFHHPTSVLVFAPSSGGKTETVLKILEERDKFFDVKIDEVLYYYTLWNDRFATVKNVKFICGHANEIPNDGKSRILISDDSMTDKTAVQRLVSIYTMESHHKNTSVFFLAQDLFFSRSMRTVSLNTKVFLLFANLRDGRSVETLFSQMSFDTSFLKEIYKDATKKKYGFLCVDLDKNTSPLLRFSTNIFHKHPSYYLEEHTYKGDPIAVEADE
jgi:hypothetical protein